MAKVTIRDNDGKQVAQFEANEDESLGTQAQDAGAPIPFSCGVGACRTCVARVNKGKEYLDEEAVGPKHITTEDNEVLTCICGLRKDVPKDAEIDIEVENL
ncbi:(2Fe-2S)-binding protein [Candidatus Gracilibacteria bacterium]|nr:(2Fe-2S)-binding protein [Candidatus Gracilibacteria bacterium]